MENYIIYFLLRLLMLLSPAISSMINAPTQEDDFFNNKTTRYWGIESHSIIFDLLNRSANPLAINIEGRTLLNLAVKKCDLELLRFVVEELQVPIPDSSSNQSILIEALDSNPFPQRSRHRFWETMNYLVEKRALHVPKSDHPQLMQTGNIFAAHEFSSFYETFAASHSISDFESAQLPPEVQRYRRNLVLQNCYRQLIKPKLAMSTRAPDTTTLTEVLLKYQGSHLSSKETTYFRHTIEAALKHDTDEKPLSPHQFERIKQAISLNINIINDLEFVEKFLHENVLPNLSQIEGRAIVKAIFKQISKQTDLSVLKNTSLREETKNFSILHEITRNIPTLKVHSELQHILQTFKRRNYINGLICILKDVQTNFKCEISSTDVEQFIEVNESNNKMTEVINTKQFLQMIQDAEVENNLIKSSQLIDVGQVIMEKQNPSVTGNYVNLFSELIKNRSLTKLHIVRRIIRYFSQKMKNLKSFFIKSIPQHALDMSTIVHFLPSIKATAKVFDLCVIEPRKCSKYFHILGATIGLFVIRKAVELPVLDISSVALKDQINKLNEVKEIGTMAKMRKSLKLRLHLRQVPIKLISAIIGLAIDIWNIIDLHSKLQACLNSSIMCSGELINVIRVKIAMEYIKIIQSVVIPCLVISLQASLAIWAGILVIEQILIPLVILITFAKTYSLSFNEILQTLAFWTLESYKDSVNCAALALEVANYTATKLLEENTAVVAVAIAIGTIVDLKERTILQRPCTINMKNTDPQNTLNLARIIPKESLGFIRLCLHHNDLPKQLNGGISADPVPSAVYYCDGAIVLGHEKRWNNVKNGYIIYLLNNANSADVYGNDQHNNQFIIKNLTDPSTIVGGQSSNHYFIMYARNTTIFLNPIAEKEIIDFSESQIWLTRFQFYYENSKIIGTLSFDYGWPCEIYWQHPSMNITTKKNNERLLRTKQILGRTRKPDEIQCLDSAMYHKIIKTHVIFANGHGGRSSTEMDIIKNCQQTVLHPFSKYISTIENDFAINAHIDKSTVTIPDRAKTYSMIEIQKGQVVMTFRGSPLTQNTISMKYKPWNNVLTWELLWSNGTIMVLDIKNFYKDLTDDHDNQPTPAVKIHDEYSGGIFFPVIHLSEDITNTTIIDVQRFLVGSTVTGAHFIDAFDNYRYIIAMTNPKFDIGLLVSLNSTSQSYFFGKNDSDTIYLEPNIKYAAGLNGVDYYTLLAMSPEYTVISNEASDDEVDYLVIPKGICDSLNIRRHDLHLPLIQPGDNDIIVTCTSRASSRRINIILEKYLLDRIYQHLCFLWNNTPYMIIPKHWNFTLNDVDSNLNTFDIIQFYSLKNVDKPVIINVNSTGACVVLYVSDKYEPFEAHVSDTEHQSTNVLLTLKNMSSVSLNLQDFYIIEDGYETISPEWINKTFVIADDFSEGSLVNEIDAIEINRLVDLSRLETIKLREKFEKSIHRLHGNNSKNITIDYIHESISNHDEIPRTLELSKIQPDETYAEWNSEKEALLICTKYSCVTIVNWCKSADYRLQLIHFNILTSRTPIIIEDLDHLKCQEPYNGNQDNIVKVLNFKLMEAQKLLLMMKNSFSDTAIYQTCIGIFYAENVTSLPIFWLFNFLNEYEQSAFAWKYCDKVITTEKINNLTQHEVQDIIEFYIAQYKIKRNLGKNTNWLDEQKIFSLLRKSFDKFITDNWNNFLSHIYKILFPTEFPLNFKRKTDIENGHLSHLDWYEQLIRYFQKCD